MKIAQIKTKIISNKRFSGNYWHLEFESGVIAKNALPGQFVNIKVNNGLEPLLRRPISVHRVKGRKVKLFYEVVGAGTQVLSQRKPGELLDIIGPLGNGFDYRGAIKAKAGKNILVAGGMGVAPLVFLAQRLLRPSGAGNDTIILIGAKTKKQVLCAQEFKALGCTVRLATDDGSVGFRGKVTDLLKQQLSVTGHRSSVIYTCGPRAMLKAVSEIARENKINAQLSLEEHMACGIGACLGCVVSTKDGYQRVCKDGPVFLSQELIW
ncbi:MAG: dihydroorotate dehydrogenase electron transfer subunit [Candidatus Omnitrophica bacterium]|nr:dihydroorotate dehydrogenase electron transfer subunit [Candidatus Omnitrophota bacterium]